MMHLMKTDIKKIFYLQGYRNYLLATFLLSILFGITFLFTIDFTAGKSLAALSTMEVMDITLLGIDVTAIMLIIFIANIIAKAFTTSSIHTALAITPSRQKYFFSTFLFTLVLSLLISIAIVSTLFLINQFILSANEMGKLFLDQMMLLKLTGAIIMPLFYSLLSMASTFYAQSASAGITFALGVMFLPAFIKMFSADVTSYILPFFPERALHVLTDISTIPVRDSIIKAFLILLIWVVIVNLLGMWKFKKTDF